jgi:2,5-diketo-D-gluconate reductase A
MTQIPNVTLAGNIEMPQLGFGVFQVPDEETKTAVSTALEAGYRSIDTAAIYRNEDGVGQALAESGLNRQDYFVTSKLWNADQGYDATLRAFDASLEKLGLDSLDLYLIHWPTPERDLYVDTWKAFQKLRADGRVRAIGVSNFQPAHIQRLLDSTGTPPAINQIELHPLLQQEEPREFHERHGIATEAWSPLAQGGDVLGHPVITGLAEKHNRTSAQVILRWHLQIGNVVIPKSVTPSRVRENLDVFGFELDDDDLKQVSSLDAGKRIGPDPDEFNVA